MESILAAIEGATRTLRVKMFVFSDPSLLQAVIAARRRGVKVQIMLNPARRSGEHDNEATRKSLERADIDVKDANPAFDVTPAHLIAGIITEKGLIQPVTAETIRETLGC